jgi:hypothetical protein
MAKGAEGGLTAALLRVMSVFRSSGSINISPSGIFTASSYMGFCKLVNINALLRRQQGVT